MKASLKVWLIAVVICSHMEAQQSDAILELNRKVLAKQVESKAEKQIALPTTKQSAEPPKLAPTLSQRTHFISDGSRSVMIPRGAVIHLPVPNRITVQEEIVGKLVEWDEFFVQNRNALRLEEVNIKQLQGLELIDEKATKRIKTSNFPTLTSYQNRVVALAANRKETN